MNYSISVLKSVEHMSASYTKVSKSKNNKFYGIRPISNKQTDMAIEPENVKYQAKIF